MSITTYTREEDCEHLAGRDWIVDWWVGDSYPQAFGDPKTITNFPATDGWLVWLWNTPGETDTLPNIVKGLARYPAMNCGKQFRIRSRKLGSIIPVEMVV